MLVNDQMRAFPLRWGSTFRKPQVYDIIDTGWDVGAAEEGLIGWLVGWLEGAVPAGNRSVLADSGH